MIDLLQDLLSIRVVQLVLSWTVALVTIVFLIGLSMSWSNIRGAPWVPTPIGTVHDMLQLADVGHRDVVYDLGCGDGRLIVAAARKYGARAVGIEVDPMRFLWCQLLITVLGLRSRVTVRFGDLFKHDVSEATAVMVYLLPDTNRRLQHKLVSELPAEAQIVAHSFTMPALEEVTSIESPELYLYRPVMSAKGEATPSPERAGREDQGQQDRQP